MAESSSIGLMNSIELSFDVQWLLTKENYKKTCSFAYNITWETYRVQIHKPNTTDYACSAYSSDLRSNTAN